MEILNIMVPKTHTTITLIKDQIMDYMECLEIKILLDKEIRIIHMEELKLIKIIMKSLIIKMHNLEEAHIKIAKDMDWIMEYMVIILETNTWIIIMEIQ